MRINFDRLSKLAGLPVTSKKGSLYEGKEHGEKEEGMSAMAGDLHEEEEEKEEMMQYEEEGQEEMMQYEAEGQEEMMQYEEEEKEEMAGMDELIEVDEAMLVQELRRAKRIMKESKRKRLSESRRRQIFQKQLKQVIDEEVQNVMSEMNLNSQWIYGEDRPTRSRSGYTHQGSFLPGLGFKR